jgi:hypothetical protein
MFGRGRPNVHFASDHAPAKLKVCFRKSEPGSRPTVFGPKSVGHQRQAATESRQGHLPLHDRADYAAEPRWRLFLVAALGMERRKVVLETHRQIHPVVQDAHDDCHAPAPAAASRVEPRHDRKAERNFATICRLGL